MKPKVFLIFFLLAAASAGNYNVENDSTEPKIPCNKTVFLLSSSSGLQFSRNVNSDGTSDIIYDCALGIRNEGVVYLNDNLHLGTLKTLHIKNCKNITLNTLEGDDSLLSIHFESIKVENVDYLLLISRRHNYYEDFRFYYQSINEINLTNVKFFDININSKHFFKNLKYINFENVGMNNLELLAQESLKKVILNGIKVFENNWPGTIKVHNERGSLLIIKNSHFFQYIKLEISSDKVEISNNTFLSESNFYIQANRSLKFSNNFLKRVNQLSFNSSDIEIVGNNFVEMENQFLENVKVEGEDYIVRKLNVSNNKFNLLPKLFLNLSPESRADEIILENNFLNCSCKNWFALDYMSKSSLMVDKMFLNKMNNNVCENLNNCSLSHVLLHVVDLCTRRFSCADARETESDVYN